MLYDSALPASLADASKAWVYAAYVSYLRQSFSDDDLRGLSIEDPCMDILLSYFCRRFDVSHHEYPVTLELPSDSAPILHVLKNLIQATVRTNLYVSKASALTLDIHHDLHTIPEIDAIPGLREFYVFHPEFKGVHLRAAPVARGGIRISDREDYRKEAFDLLNTQRLKNVVVVPDGAKGVVFPQRGYPPEQAYRCFIASLLEVMDNLDHQHQIIPASCVRALDGADTYLVAAPDKGTASYAGIANEVALHAGFWLDDAFASAGVTGYDHKQIGITSKGVWISVATHLAYLGRQVSKEAPLSMVGVGDMSGDVFGNGLLHMPCIQLRAAFDHRHIFLDPNPDIDVSYQERHRLFQLTHSSWADYDASCLSKGAQIISRTATRVRLTPEVQAMLDLSSDCAASADDLIPALLTMPCDVLWFGGIGTYVKGKDESDVSIGDQRNSHIRVCGSDIHAKIIAEGANLACTQQGRIAFAKKGGVMNTDALDNCAGVMCSDHEVNFKILFQATSIAPHARNDLLHSMTGEMVDHVLAENYWQNISLYYVQRSGKIDNLTRPELVVRFLEGKKNLKIHLAQETFADAVWEKALNAYFPSRLYAKYPRAISTHFLRKDILCTVLSNHLIDTLPHIFLQYPERIEQSEWALSLLYIYRVFEFDQPRLWIGNAPFHEQTDRFSEVEACFSALHAYYPEGDITHYQELRAELESNPQSQLGQMWHQFLRTIQAA